MNRHDVDWWGYWPATPTPFTSDARLDEAALRGLMSLYVRHGVHGVLVNGSTGEWFSQSIAERQRVAEVALAQVERAIPVVIGVSAYTAGEAAELARHAERAGAAGLLATPPPYVHCSADEIVAFYREVSEATALPFMVYNWPRGVAVDIGQHPGLFRRLADLDRVVAVKDSTGDWLSMLTTVELLSADVRVFGSFIHRRGLAVLLGLGGDGSIDGGGLASSFGVPFYDAVRSQDRARAEELADRYTAVSSQLIRGDYSGVFASPICQLKAAMRLLGQPGGWVRAPLLELTNADALAELDRLLDSTGLRAEADAVGSAAR